MTIETDDAAIAAEHWLAARGIPSVSGAIKAVKWLLRTLTEARADRDKAEAEVIRLTMALHDIESDARASTMTLRRKAHDAVYAEERGGD